MIEVGGLEGARDFLSVDDVVAAYLLLIERPEDVPGAIYNVASGGSVVIGDVLAKLVRLSRVPMQVRIDPARVRRDPPAAYVGDASRLREATGWRPRGDLDAVLADVLAEQRRRVVAR